MSEETKSLNKRVQYSLKMGALLNAEDIEKEYHLQHTKWFGYRFMSPWETTIKFLTIYNEAYRHSYTVNFDRDHGQRTQGCSLKAFLFDAANRTRMWRARQRADLKGMRYEEYCAWSFEFAARRTRKFLPQPNQLHFKGAAHELWCKFRDTKWSEYLADGLIPPPSDPAYRIENFKNLAAQRAYREWIVDQAISGPRTKDIMRLFSVEKAQIPLEEFEKAMPDDAYQTQHASLQSDVRHFDIQTEPLPSSHRGHLFQSCFGLPMPPKQDYLTATCTECPLRNACEKVRAKVEAQLVQKHGSIDPVKARRKKGANDRKRRQRERERLAAASAAIVMQPA